MTTFIDNALPNLLGMPLRRVRPEYPELAALQPQVVHDFQAFRGKVVELNRYDYFPRQGKVIANYTRDQNSVIGTARSEPLTKATVKLYLKELTGPNDINGLSSSFHVTAENLRFAQQALWDTGNLMAFHQAIGSENMADDYQSAVSSFVLNELASGSAKYNPGGAADNATYATTAAATFNYQDLMRVKQALVTANTQAFPSTGKFHVLASSTFMRHLETDPDFLQTQRAVLNSGLVPVNESPLFGGKLGVTPSGLPAISAMTPVIYGDFAFWRSRMLDYLEFATTSSITTPSTSNLTAKLAYFFGVGTVGEASGNMGPQILIQRGDYDRHINLIWQRWADWKFLLTNDENSGTCIEARTYAS
jgi:hypothetical protein